MHPTKLRLLYLENDVHQCEEVAEVLRACGLYVVPCHHVACVHRHILDFGVPDAFLFDLAISDVMNGFELAELLVGRHSLATARFTFLSAWTSDFTRPAMFGDGQVFQKPLRGEQFTSLVEHIQRVSVPSREE